jgi:NADH:ubiquinone oxidoreductase subunit 3 (subunit A)
MDNFNLKKYLVENKTTTNSKMMNENLKTQSPVEWLEEKLKISFGDEIKPLRGFFVQAKEMEKEQILDAYECGFESEHDARIPQSSMMYYNKTYGGGE